MEAPHVIPAHSFGPSEDTLGFPVIRDDEPYESWSPDGTVKLFLCTAAFDFHLDQSARALPTVIRGYYDFARRLGFMPMDYDECPPELQDNGFVRSYLIPIEPVSDIRWEMPSLVETGIGPYSMEIPAVDPTMVVQNYARDLGSVTYMNDVATLATGPITMPRTTTTTSRPGPGPARYQTTPRGAKRQGRHRAP